MDILELFDKHLELVQEHDTWLEYICPICKHSGLKIKKENSHYKNFKCNCDTRKISSYILSKSGEKIERKPREPPVFVPEIPNVLGVKLSLIENSLSLSVLESEYNPQAKIYYPYSETQRTIRINKIKSTGKKIIFPQVLSTGGWVNGIGDNLFPIYTDRFNVKRIQDEFVLREKRQCLIGELIIVVEGEKCVQYLQSQGIEAMSFLNVYTASMEKLKLVLGVSESLIPNLKQVLYIPDLDIPGLKKAVTIQQAFWSLGVPCKIFDIRTRLLSPIGKGINFDKGYDIADYIKENLDSNLMEIFENEFSNK